METRSPPQQYFPAVQGLRGFSALSVFGVHIYLMALHGGFFPAVPSVIEASLSSLGQGVALFFIISGFVIPPSLFRHRDVRRFLIDRLLRIMPVFLIIHLVVFAIGPFIGYKWLRGIGATNYLILFATNMTFTALPLGLPLGQQNSWTLTYEWAFYLVVSAAWMLLATTRHRLLRMVIVGLAAASLCIAFPICLYFLTGVGFSTFRSSIRIGQVAECLLIPLCLIGFFYCAQFVGYVFAVPLALVLFNTVLQDGSVTSRALCSPALQYCGKISYSLYMLHPLMMFPYQVIGAQLVHRKLDIPLLFSLFVILGVTTTFAASALSYHWIEVRMRARIAERLGRRAASHLQTSWSRPASLLLRHPAGDQQPQDGP